MSHLCDTSTSQGGSGTPVFATKLSFSLLREFGTIIMSDRPGSSIVDLTSELYHCYPKHKKYLKSLVNGVDHLLKHQNLTNMTENSKNISTGQRDVNEKRPILFTLFLYSIPDD